MCCFYTSIEFIFHRKKAVAIFLIHPYINSFINLSILNRLSEFGSRGQRPKQGGPCFSVTSSSSSRGIPRCSQASQKTCTLQCVLSLPEGLLPEGRVWNTSLERRPVGILTKSLSHLIWLFSAQRSSFSAPSSSWMTDLLKFPNLAKGPRFLTPA